jgi:hypothetical protein
MLLVALLLSREKLKIEVEILFGEKHKKPLVISQGLMK